MHRSLNEDDVAVARTADTLVANRLAGDLDQRRSVKRECGVVLTQTRRRARGAHNDPRGAQKSRVETADGSASHASAWIGARAASHAVPESARTGAWVGHGPCIDQHWGTGMVAGPSRDGFEHQVKNKGLPLDFVKREGACA
jgi:hypothetical protein